MSDPLSMVDVNVPDALRHVGAAVMLGLERAADRLAREMWLEARHEYYAEDAVATEEGVDALGTYTERMGDELVVAGVVGRKPQNWFIEHGRKPGAMPLADPPATDESQEPYPEVLVEWMRHKGLTPRDGDASPEGYRNAARSIGWAIREFGYDAREPVTHAIENLEADGKLQRIVNDSLVRSLRARGLMK